MTDASYGYTKNLGKVDFMDAEARITAALKSEGFGVLTEIDVTATLKAKLDVDFRKYKIYGACNPPLAHKALSADPMIGLLLPCNVVAFEEDDGTLTASFAAPLEMFKVVNRSDLAAFAEEVDNRIRRAVDSL